MKRVIFLLMMLLCLTGCNSLPEVVPLELGNGYREAVSELLPGPPEAPHLEIERFGDKFLVSRGSIENYFNFKVYDYPKYIQDVQTVIKYMNK